MRKIWCVGVLFCLISPLTWMRGQEAPEATQLRAAEYQLTDFYKQRDVAGLAGMLDEDFVITFEDGSTFSKTGYISFMAAPSEQVAVAEMLDMKIRIHGTTGIATGVYHERGTTKGKAYEYRDRFTDVWKKKNGKWLMIASHYAIPLKAE